MMFKTSRKKKAVKELTREQRIAAVVDEICNRPQVATQLNEAVDPKFRDAAKPVYKNNNRVQRWLGDRAQTGMPRGGWV